METIKERIISELQKVVDPETGADVWRMRLVEDLTVDHKGHVSYSFRPSSPLCPLAIPLAQSIKSAINRVAGVTGQTIQVVNYVQAAMLTELLSEK